MTQWHVSSSDCGIFAVIDDAACHYICLRPIHSNLMLPCAYGDTTTACKTIQDFVFASHYEKSPIAAAGHHVSGFRFSVFADDWTRRIRELFIHCSHVWGPSAHCGYSSVKRENQRQLLCASPCHRRVTPTPMQPVFWLSSFISVVFIVNTFHIRCSVMAQNYTVAGFALSKAIQQKTKTIHIARAFHHRHGCGCKRALDKPQSIKSAISRLKHWQRFAQMPTKPFPSIFASRIFSFFSHVYHNNSAMRSNQWDLPPATRWKWVLMFACVRTCACLRVVSVCLYATAYSLNSVAEVNIWMPDRTHENEKIKRKKETLRLILASTLVQIICCWRRAILLFVTIRTHWNWFTAVIELTRIF